MRRGIVSLAEMVNRVEIADYDHNAHGRVVLGNGDVPAGLMARLRQPSHLTPGHGQARSWNLRIYELGLMAMHEQRIPLLPPTREIRQEARLVDAWSERIDELEEQTEDVENLCARCDVIDTVLAVEMVVERRVQRHVVVPHWHDWRPG